MSSLALEDRPVAATIAEARREQRQRELDARRLREARRVAAQRERDHLDCQGAIACKHV